MKDLKSTMFEIYPVGIWVKMDTDPNITLNMSGAVWLRVPENRVVFAGRMFYAYERVK